MNGENQQLFLFLSFQLLSLLLQVVSSYILRPLCVQVALLVGFQCDVQCNALVHMEVPHNFLDLKIPVNFVGY